MSRFCALFSGSSGNCTYIGGSEGGILIDAGVSAKGIVSALAEREIDIAGIRAVFVTHEHSDHIKGLRVLASRRGIPVYASAGTLAALPGCEEVETRSMDGAPVHLAGMEISRFATDHDCEGSSGYVVTTPDGRRMAVCTDLGHVSDGVRAAIQGCDLVLLESNHDVMMLQNGGYPYYLKRRILSENGHLSNVCCAAELPELVKSGATRLVLGHLSRENNYPELALACARAALMGGGMRENIDYILCAASPAGGKMLVL